MTQHPPTQVRCKKESDVAALLMVWFLSFCTLGYVAISLLQHPFFVDENLRLLADAFILRDVRELSSLRIFVIFPIVPICLLVLLSYIPSIPPLILPLVLSVTLVSTLITRFLWRLWQVNIFRIILVLLWGFLLIHPVVLATAVMGGNFTWAFLSSFLIAQGLFRLGPQFHTLPLVYISLVLVTVFLMDPNYFGVIMATLCALIFCINHRGYYYDYLSLWLTLLFPLFLIILLVIVAGFETGMLRELMEKLLKGLDFASWRVNGLVHRLAIMVKVTGLNLLIFPHQIWNFLLLRTHKSLSKVFLAMIFLPGLIAFFSADQLQRNESYLVYALGPTLAGIYHTYHYIRKASYLISAVILTGAGGILLWVFPNLDSALTKPLPILFSSAPVQQDIQEDVLLGERLKHYPSIMLDNHSAYSVIAGMGGAKNLIIPTMDLFQLEEEQNHFASSLILIPQPSHPNYSKDLVAKILPISSKSYLHYHTIYKSKRWMVVQRNGE